MQRGILFPIPLNLHIIFVAFSLIFLTISFIRERYIYKPFLLAGIMGTLLVYIDDSTTFFFLLGGLEFTILIITIITMRQAYKKRNKKRI
mgnify:FL=1|jgi:hypothetical protein